MNDPCRRYLRTLSIFVAATLFAIIPVNAASIPAWLDDAITQWNEENPEVKIQFVEIKDSFVWYMIPNTDEIGSKELRESIYEISQKNGYTKMEAEELITLGRPPSPTGPGKQKKCWQRGFTLEIDTGRQRMLTTQVCADGDNWFAGFRIVQ
jgi:hypothetical protein